MKCLKCDTENSERNYYCSWCGFALKKSVAGKLKKHKNKFNYLLDLSIVEDKSKDKDYYAPYRSKNDIHEE